MNWQRSFWQIPSLARRLVLVALVYVGYAVALLLLYPLVGPGVGGLNVLPVVVTSWFFGRRGGLLSVVTFLLLTPFLFILAGAQAPTLLVFAYVVPNIATVVIVGLTVGWLKEILIDMQIQSDELKRERMSLQQSLEQRERIQADLLQAKDRAESANRAKSAFLATMSHELRTPLTTVIGYCQLLQLRVNQQRLTSFAGDLTKIESASTHLQRLIDDVLDLSRIEADRTDLRIAEIDIATIARDAMTMHQHAAAQRGNQVRLDCAPAIGTFHTDGTRARQILFNLVGNAVKFTEAGTITIEAEKVSAEQASSLANAHGEPSYTFDSSERWVLFRVCDSGIGFEPTQARQILEPFVQLDASPTRQYGGAGLGLTITQRLCHLLGGYLLIESQVGSGSAFTVLLPVQHNLTN